MLIEGFKSYKDQTSTDEFDPKINVVGEAASAVLRCSRGGGGAGRAHHTRSWLRAMNVPAWNGIARVCKRDAIVQRDIDAWHKPAHSNNIWIMLTSPDSCLTVGANGSGKSNFFHGEARCRRLGLGQGLQFKHLSAHTTVFHTVCLRSHPLRAQRCLHQHARGGAAAVAACEHTRSLVMRACPWLVCNRCDNVH